MDGDADLPGRGPNPGLLARAGTPTPPGAVLTVGHGTLPQDDLLALLRGAGIEVLVDVRSYPGSRRNPQFNRDAMADWLPAGGVDYRWEQSLGGRRKGRPDSRHTALRHDAFRAYADHMDSDEFRAGLDWVLEVVAATPTAVMCSEAVWWKCHRRLLADAAVLLREAPVVHLFHDGRLQPHPVTPEARHEGDNLVYDGGAPPLPLS
jgi:uncharacterized protein (DUF488 family)